MKIYFLSGLGADKTVFQFLDLKEYDPVFIEWIAPEKNESLPHYALRLKEKFIPDGSIVVGLSFGGMLGMEMAKKFSDLHLILLSSAKIDAELPYYYKIGNWLPLHKISPPALQKNTMLHMKWLFGLKTKPARKIYEDLIRNSDTAFNAWAIESILGWKNEVIPPNIYHIHGTADKVLPISRVKPDLIVENGGHLMVLEQPALISDLLLNVIRSRQKEYKIRTTADR